MLLMVEKGIRGGMCQAIHRYAKALNHGLILKKVHRVIQFNQKAWLKSYIDMNTKLRTEAKTDFEKDFFKLVNKCSFWNNNGKCKKAQRYQISNNR